MKEFFVATRFAEASLDLINRANEVIADYAAQGFTLTLRQLFYQFVSRDWLPNTVANYKRLGSLVNDGRLAGLIDWSAIEDRTRNLAALAHWDGPDDIVASCARQYRRDLWATQEYYLEVWIEKEALAGVFEGVCNRFRVPFLCCRGYTSQSEMYVAAKRFVGREPKHGVILHFGDHDPSGIDMTRDIQDRLSLFGAEIELTRVALNMAQIEEHDPPPNPAKVTDSRFGGYQAEYGDESWELDALNPTILAGLVEEQIDRYLDQAAWDTALAQEEAERGELQYIANNWDSIERHGEDDE